jgi:hypothetical protein
VVVATTAVLANTFGDIPIGAMQTPVVGVLVSAIVLDLVLRYRERCLGCGGRKLQSEAR